VILLTRIIGKSPQSAGGDELVKKHPPGGLAAETPDRRRPVDRPRADGEEFFVKGTSGYRGSGRLPVPSDFRPTPAPEGRLGAS
jgi:hypothetical protein